MAYQSTYTGAQIDTCISAYQNATQVQAAINAAKLAMYPVGAIYISANNTNPSTFIGGTWVQIQDTFLLAAGTTYTAGDTGGEATHTLTVEESPSHTHDRGTMDITGSIYCYSDYNKGNNSYDSKVTGAFHFTTGVDEESGTSSNLSSGSSDAQRSVQFSASRSWTGVTSSVGGGLAHNNMPPYLVVYVWQRTA